MLPSKYKVTLSLGHAVAGISSVSQSSFHFASRTDAKYLYMTRCMRVRFFFSGRDERKCENSHFENDNFATKKHEIFLKEMIVFFFF